MWGILITLKISVFAEALAIIFGLFICFIRISKSSILREVAASYIEIGRGMPILVVIFWVYFGLPMLTGFAFSAFVSGIAALTFVYTAYLAEIFRSGIEAIKIGQEEAAYSLGFSKIQTMRRIVLPQAFRIVVPPVINTFVSMLQNSALCSVIGVDDLMRRSQLIVTETWRPFEVYTCVAIIYLVMTITFSKLSDYLEKRKTANV